MKISIIVAVDENNLIGKRNSLPWHLPADLKHFKQTTMGHHILFGQTTFGSIGRPLPGRTTMILTNDPKFKQENCVIVHSPQEAIDHAKNKKEEELFVCGGAMVYRSFLPLADKIYMTQIHHKFEGDVYFPEWNKDEWKETSRKHFKMNKENKYDFDVAVYSKISQKK